jgi:hypothetical protein
VSSDRSSRVRELVDLALDALPGMQRSDGVFCFEVVAPSLEARGRSPRYSLITLLGLLRAEQSGTAVPIDTGALKQALIGELDSRGLSSGDIGLYLWVDSRSGLELPGRLLDAIEKTLNAVGGLERQEGLELAWLILGLANAIGAGCADPRAERLLAKVLNRKLARVEMPHGLFRHSDVGWRARFPHFATQIYGVQALAELALVRDRGDVLPVARRVADLLVRVQRPDGGWPWMYDVRRGTVMEPYRIYSVHQVAMAQMALEPLSEATGEAGYRDAAERGFPWVWGENAAGLPTLDQERKLMYRSIRRRGGLDRLVLWTNTATALLGRPLLADLRGPVEVEATDRPYHHGWILEAWCGREQLATSSSSS